MIILHGTIALVVLAILAAIVFGIKTADLAGWARRKVTGQPKQNPYGTLSTLRSSDELKSKPADSEDNQWG
jgi:hypothetical protein